LLHVKFEEAPGDDDMQRIIRIHIHHQTATTTSNDDEWNGNVTEAMLSRQLQK
jgi:hypothetical protein